MVLWQEWGDEGGTADERRGREARWRRAWVLMDGRRAVRRWVDERGKQETEGAGVDQPVMPS